MLNLDTHIFLHALAGELTPKERKALSDKNWSISAIVLWEISMLARLGRIRFDWEDPAVRSVLKRIHIWPITVDICKKLGELDFKGDPADKLIAATSLVHDLPLATRDMRIRKSKLLGFVG